MKIEMYMKCAMDYFNNAHTHTMMMNSGWEKIRARKGERRAHFAVMCIDGWEMSLFMRALY
jgi:hypothetical protein